MTTSPPPSSRPLPFIRTDHVLIDGRRFDKGTVVFLDGSGHRLVGTVENPANGAVWVDLIGVDHHRHRSVRPDRFAELVAAG